MTLTNRQIEILRDEAGVAGDFEQVAVCDIALHGRATGWPAIELSCYRVLSSLGLGALCIDGEERNPYSLEVHAIARRSPESVSVEGDRDAARAECARVIADAAGQ